MATKILLIVILFLTALTTIFSTCKKGGILGCPNSTYSFGINARVYPDNDTISIGDTIWAAINSSEAFVDQSGQQVNFSNANNLGTDMSFVKLVNTSPVQVDGAIFLLGRVSSPGLEAKQDTAGQP